MPVMNTLSEAFAYFGARAANPRWSWAAQSDDGSVVVLTMWEDIARHENGHVVYDIRAHHDLAQWRGRPGNRDRRRKLIHARDHCDRKFRVVHVRAVDPKAGTRRTRSRYEADDRLVMKLEFLNEETGEFCARSVD